MSIALCPALLTAAAASFIGAGAESPSFRGRLTEMMLRRVGLPNRGPWSTAFVNHVGYWSHYDPEACHSGWPLPATNDPGVLAAFGNERGILDDWPEEGDVVLMWSAESQRWFRAAILLRLVISVPHREPRGKSWICTTIEGDTDESGAFGGGGIHMLRRRISVDRGDLFLRWTLLDTRTAPSDPVIPTRKEGGRLVVLNTR